MKKLLSALVFLIALLTVHTPTISAQSQDTDQSFINTRGVFLNVHASGTGMRVESDEDDTGLGFGATLGYGINQVATLYVRGHISDMGIEDNATLRRVEDETYSLAHVDLGVRFTNKDVSERGALYGGAAVGGLASSYDAQTVSSDAILRGLSLTGEVGFMYFLVPRIAVDIGFNLTAGRYSTLDIEGRTESVELDTLSARINAGLSIYPFR